MTKNHSGFVPAGHRILVLPLAVEDHDAVYASAKASGIDLSKTSMGREQDAQVDATLIAVGKDAWTDTGDGQPWAKVGQRVVVGKFAGTTRIGDDGKTYRVLNDLDLVGVLEAA